MKRITMITGFLVMTASAATQAGSASALVRTEQLLRLGLPLNGVVASIAVQAGSQVKKGDELLRLDCRAYDIKRALAKAGADAAEVVMEKARAELDRTTDMYDQDLIADVEMQNTEDYFTEVEARYREASAAQRLAELNQTYCTLRSPVDGTVLYIDTNPGDVIAGEYNPRDLLGILGPGTPVADFTLPESDLIAIGQTVSVSANGREFSGIVTKTDKQHVRLALPADAGLEHGQSVAVTY
ncbi:MAG: biotin/lipoyl-binding protein [Gammaproteobacteria bacterium]|nr:biotin/lipoyl-binding protein [Gammaproteobacteria bacterium]